MLQGVVVGLLEALEGPVGRADGADLALVVQAVQYVHDGPDGHRGIVAVEQIHVQMIRLELGQGVVAVMQDVEVGDALAPAVVVRALGQDHHLVPQTPRLHPLAEGLLAVVVGAVEAVHAQGVHGIQQGKGGLKALVEVRRALIHRAERGEHLRRRGAEHDAGDGLVHVGHGCIDHGEPPYALCFAASASRFCCSLRALRASRVPIQPISISTMDTA